MSIFDVKRVNDEYFCTRTLPVWRSGAHGVLYSRRFALAKPVSLFLFFLFLFFFCFVGLRRGAGEKVGGTSAT